MYTQNSEKKKKLIVWFLVTAKRDSYFYFYLCNFYVVSSLTITRPNECFIDRGRDVGVNDRTLNNGLMMVMAPGRW